MNPKKKLKYLNCLESLFQRRLTDETIHKRLVSELSRNKPNLTYLDFEISLRDPKLLKGGENL